MEQIKNYFKKKAPIVATISIEQPFITRKFVQYVPYVWFVQYCYTSFAAAPISEYVYDAREKLLVS